MIGKIRDHPHHPCWKFGHRLPFRNPIIQVPKCEIAGKGASKSLETHAGQFFSNPPKKKIPRLVVEQTQLNQY